MIIIQRTANLPIIGLQNLLEIRKNTLPTTVYELASSEF